MPTLISKFGHSLRAQGLWRASLLVGNHLVWLRDRWIDRRFDRRWGTDTCGLVPRAELGLEGEHAGDSSDYQPVQVPVFRAIMRDLPIEHARYAFVDFGSGKGRALLMAARCPFRRIIGVELSPVLHEAALRNVALFDRRRAAGTPIELYRGDAVAFPLPEGDAVCFFYNAFGRPVMEKMAAKLEASLRRPRRMFVVYRNPVCADVLDGARFLRLLAARRGYRIYRTG
jgi:SAM-dependent methyltransferase